MDHLIFPDPVFWLRDVFNTAFPYLCQIGIFQAECSDILDLPHRSFPVVKNEQPSSPVFMADSRPGHVCGATGLPVDRLVTEKRAGPGE